jgi:prephenate dehydrogenase
MTFGRISIIGLGLIGGSLAMAIRAGLSDCQITGYDAQANAMDEAMAAGVIDQTAQSAAMACEGADCVVVCVPVGGMSGILEEIAGYLEPGAVVTDVCSTKRSVVAMAGRLLPAAVHFVGSHPMAGRELSGLGAARPDLFNAALCLTTPIDQTDLSALEKVEAFWRSLGAKTVRLSPEEHDRLVAQISHLPHLLASALVNSVSKEALQIAGPGFRDATRIAAGDPALWRQILEDNARQVRAALCQLRRELDAVDIMLEQSQGDDLQTWLATAALRRREAGSTR